MSVLVLAVTSGLPARRIEALSHDEVYYCYIYLYYCLAARRIEALSDDEVIRMLRARTSSDV